MGGLVYGGKFEQHINELYSPKNIGETAKKFKEYEKQNGPYSFGKFTKFLVPDKANWTSEAGDGHGGWDKHSGAIPEAIRNKITEVIATNLRSEHPLPLVLKVGENVDHSHDLHVKTFAHNGHMHIGLHMLCPNTSLKK
jgi:hypothetical protein